MLRALCCPGAQSAAADKKDKAVFSRMFKPAKVRAAAAVHPASCTVADWKDADILHMRAHDFALVRVP